MQNPEDLDLRDEDNDAQPPENGEPLPEDADQPEEPESLEEAESPASADESSKQIEEAAQRPVVFISHRQGFDLDQNIATMLYENLTENTEKCDVYLDTQQLASVRWAELIQQSIKDADFVIALITENANRSDWIAFELSEAHRRWVEFRKPVLIPVHLEPIAEYEGRIGAALSGFHRIDYKGDNQELIAAVRASIFGGGVGLSTTPHGMEGFLVKDSRRDLMRAAFLNSSKLEAASRQLQMDKLLWLIGEDGARNYVARSLAVKEQLAEGAGEAGQERKLYEVTRSLRWSKVNSTAIHDSIIIFRDVAPSAVFDEEKYTNELASLEALMQRRNTIILTTSEDFYLEIQQEMRRQDFKKNQRIDVCRDFYNDADKQAIFEKLLDFSKEIKVINSRQYEWACGLLSESALSGKAAAASEYSRNEGRELFDSIIKQWSPADIERFVTLHLPQVKKANDILKLLKRNANLDNEIHSWFISLDDSTRCFVMTLALFSGLSAEQLWEKYKSIVENLRRLDVSLSLWPLGICRQRASLYVTVEGTLDFKEERFADSVYREIAKNYREYFIELIPLIEKWSVPPGRKQRRTEAISAQRKQLAVQGAEVRATIAHMVGKLSLNGFTELSGLINYWAGDPIFKVREAVALTMEQAASESLGAKYTFSMLDKWCGERSNNEDTLHRMWAAASALGSIAAANTGKPVYMKALNRLNKLARDTRGSIRFYISIPLKKVARKVPLSEIESLLSLVVKDEQPFTRINVAEVLNEARVFNKEAASEVLDRWFSSEDYNQRWAAICSVIIWRKQGDAERNQEVIRFLEHDAAIVASVFVEIVKHKFYKARIPTSFEKLILQMPEDAREKFVSGLAEIHFNTLAERLLERFRSSGDPTLERLVFEVRAARWKHLLSMPRDFIRDLREELNRERMSLESYASLTLLQRPEPDGSRRQFICALVDGLAHNRAALEKLLTKLEQSAPSIFERLVVEARLEAFKRLFYDPAAFIEAVTADMRRTEATGETQKVLELLAQPEPTGYHEELLQALAHSYALNPAPVTALLTLFRKGSSHTLKSIAFEFNYRMIEGSFSAPTQFLAKILSAMRDAAEWEEAIQILSYLAVSEPQGKRRLLIQALAQAKALQPQEVDNLLRHPSFQSQPNLTGLRLEVRLAAMLSSVFVPNFVSRFFIPTR